MTKRHVLPLSSRRDWSVTDGFRVPLLRSLSWGFAYYKIAFSTKLGDRPPSISCRSSSTSCPVSDFGGACRLSFPAPGTHYRNDRSRFVSELDSFDSGEVRPRSKLRLCSPAVSFSSRSRSAFSLVSLGACASILPPKMLFFDGDGIRLRLLCLLALCRSRERIIGRSGRFPSVAMEQFGLAIDSTTEVVSSIAKLVST